MKLSNMLMIIFMLIILILFVIGAYFIQSIETTNYRIEHISLAAYPIYESATNLEKGADQLWLGTFIYANKNTDFGRQYIKNGRRLMEENLEKLTKLNIPTSEIRIKEKNVIDAQKEVINFVDSDPVSEDKIKFSLNLLQQRISALSLELSILTDQSQEQMSSAISTLAIAKEKGKNTIRITIILIVLSILILLSISVFFSRSITNPIVILTKSNKYIIAGKYKKAQQQQNQNQNTPAEIVEMIKTRQVMLKRLLENEKTLTKEKEEIKKANKQLKKLDQLKNLFLGMVSHELKTPITPIKLEAQRFLMGATGKLNKNQKEGMKVILRNITHLNNLLSDVLDSAKLEAHKLKLYPELVDLKHIVLDVITNFKLIADKNKLSLSTNIQKLPKLNIDSKRINQVLSNLVNNSIKFTGEGGSITVSAKKEKNQIHVTVTDTGIGIPANMLTRIFDKFSQVKPSYKFKEKGTGLGLTISKMLIKQHGGKIWAENNKEGKGASFHFTLPRKNKKL